MKDALLTFSTAQAVTTAAATASTDYLDALTYGDAMGKPLWLEILVNTTVAAAAGAANVTFAFQTDDNSSFSSPTTLWTSAAIAKATLIAGYVVARFPLPAGMERYSRVVYTPDTNDLTAGKFDAHITDSVATRVK